MGIGKKKDGRRANTPPMPVKDVNSRRGALFVFLNRDFGNYSPFPREWCRVPGLRPCER